MITPCEVVRQSGVKGPLAECTGGPSFCGRFSGGRDAVWVVCALGVDKGDCNEYQLMC